MKELLQKFLIYLANEKGYSDNTLTAYNKDIEEFIEIALKTGKDAKPGDVTKFHIRQYLHVLKTRENCNETIYRKLSALKSFYRYLIITKVITMNPFSAIMLPKTGKKLPDFIDRDMFLEFLQSFSPATFPELRDKAIIELAYSCGLRIGEIFALKKTDIKLDEKLITVIGKGKKQRKIPVTKEAVKIIDEYIKKRDMYLVEKSVEEHGYLFVNKYGRHFSIRGMRGMMYKYFNKLPTAKHFSPHSIRHATASHLLDEGADIRVIQEFLGHESLSTTQKYTHTTIEKLMKSYKTAHPRAGNMKKD